MSTAAPFIYHFPGSLLGLLSQPEYLLLALHGADVIVVVLEGEVLLLDDLDLLAFVERIQIRVEVSELVVVEHRLHSYLRYEIISNCASAVMVLLRR